MEVWCLACCRGAVAQQEDVCVAAALQWLLPSCRTLKQHIWCPQTIKDTWTNCQLCVCVGSLPQPLRLSQLLQSLIINAAMFLSLKHPKLWNSLLQLIMSADLWFVVNDFWKHIFIDDQFFNLSSIVLDSYSSHLTYTWKYVHWNICKIVCLTAHLHAITCLLKFNSGFIQTLKYFVTVCFKKLQIKLFLPHE